MRARREAGPHSYMDLYATAAVPSEPDPRSRADGRLPAAADGRLPAACAPTTNRSRHSLAERDETRRRASGRKRSSARLL